MSANYKYLSSSYSYTAQGGVKLQFCNNFWQINNYVHKWSPGDVCFFKNAAMKGNLEKIVVKQVKVISKKYTNGAVIFLYIDTLNGLFNEEELISEYDALLLAKQYYEIQLANTAGAYLVCPN